MKTLLLTGAGGHLGQAIAQKFHAQGYTVLAPTRVELDLADLKTVDPYLASIHGVDAFIHCAGINEPKPFAAIQEDDVQKTMTVNTLSFYKLMHGLTRLNKLTPGGHVLAISSIYGEVSRSGRFSYTASKSCLNGMVKSLALELGQDQIKVNGLAPGFVDTHLTRKNNTPEQIAHFEQAIPLGRLAKTQDMANIAYFLASDENQYINGQVIIADGGYLAGGFQG